MSRIRVPSGARHALLGRIAKINVAIPVAQYVSATYGCKIADVLTGSGAAKLGTCYKTNSMRWSDDTASLNPTGQLSNQTDKHSTPATTDAKIKSLKKNKETDIITDAVITSA